MKNTERVDKNLGNNNINSSNNNENEKKKKKNNIFFRQVNYITSFTLCRFIYIIYIFLYFANYSACFKLSKEHNKFNYNNFLYYDNRLNDNYNGRKNALNYKSKPYNFKKDAHINNKKFKLKSEKVDKIIESLKELTLLEASELVKKIEVTFSVDLKQNVGDNRDGQGNKQNESDKDANAENEEEDENKVYDLILENVEPNKKIPIIKIIKEIKKELNLKQAKDLVDNLPHTLFEKINKETAESWKKKLTEAGGIVKLK
ncbi:50S ribosomal protein L12, apicoplast, putative [Plasmodium chabaudi chabaudi]|uniref:50S ribosomal protein L12, apicoplast, putative n=2 Tax=Plasmodium chabaudi TaxID=5825 RepID=A0A4V0K9L7_PLACU|nr:50S ribosomal protein L12, apicoplast, putative [Plasmodium chabaudi chabaudi]SCN62434.1 50S ribosomal protein L12, apicoplast, putative [Plasmodium chabaudi adami]VTZ69869.1 50S ribosomal protein L12, apicoplast, putative [Plasmodium chabaudi chabaudi]|eukprot:XP_742157.2 50S ribosomal protein L12, apicoplast, putative [Plasmodium chabaudi chabaudi]